MNYENQQTPERKNHSSIQENLEDLSVIKTIDVTFLGKDRSFTVAKLQRFRKRVSGAERLVDWILYLSKGQKNSQVHRCSRVRHCTGFLHWCINPLRRQNDAVGL